MSRLILWRLVQLPIILAVVFALTFTLVWLIPGNPLDREDAKKPPAAVQEAMMRQYNLHSPWAFAGSYLQDVFFRGDFGPSLLIPGKRVSDIVEQALPVSVMLGLAGLGVGLVLGSLAGVAGALKPGSAFDASSLAVALVGVSLPSFVTGSALLIVFAGVLRWFPLDGWGTPQQAVLPAITLGLAPAAYIARLLRLQLADLMSSDFIRTARAKGLTHRQSLFRHALKLAYLPVLSFLGPAAAATMTGSFVVEVVFNIPGMGTYFVDAVIAKDQFLVLAVVLIYASMLVLFNLAVDVAYAWLDPRIEVK